MENIITKVLVGSRLHGTFTEDSDYDYRGIHLSPLVNILSPYKKTKNTVWIEGDTDNTSYELSDFCKYATQGNMTILEILWSNIIIEDSEEALILRKNREKFNCKKRIFEASRGYASNQLKKMHLYEKEQRSAKFAVSYIRVMQQGIDMLKTGKLNPQITRNKDLIMEIKKDFKDSLLADITNLFTSLEREILIAYDNSNIRETPDFDWIENMLLDSYTQHL